MESRRYWTSAGHRCFCQDCLRSQLPYTSAMKLFRFLPLVLLALTSVRADDRATDSEKWEKDIAAFETADRGQPPKKGAILFIGSSSIRLWKTLAEDFPQHRVLNRGFGGSEIADSV